MVGPIGKTSPTPGTPGPAEAKTTLSIKDIIRKAPPSLVKAGGPFARNTLTQGPQLGRADAGSWQIADGGATRKAAAGGTSIGDFRVHFVVEL
eukprot:scaffold50038_cov81-Phaeocystis_antarctica.AAC.3